MKKEFTLFSKRRGFYKSKEPGQFAAVTTQKIAGTLNCYSGKRAKPENRIFLMYLEDMPSGFRPCKICKPKILRVGYRLDYLENRAQSLQSKPHVSLWALGITIEGTEKYNPARWYVAMNQESAEREWFKNQITLSATHLYQRAFSLALKEGKRLNLPVIKHTGVDFIVLWLPEHLGTPEQKNLVNALWDGSVTSIFRSSYQ